LLFRLRYFGPAARVARAEHEPSRAAGPASLPAYLGSLAVTMLLLSSVLRKPVDVLVLLAGLLLARPVARGVLRLTRLAGVLAAIAWPIRLIAGFALALAFAWYFLAIVGVSLVSPFFNMVIAIAVGFIIIEIFRAADEVVATRRPAGGHMASALGKGALLLLAVPAVALADNSREHADMDDVAAACRSDSCRSTPDPRARRAVDPGTAGARPRESPVRIRVRAATTARGRQS
jgi:hypothetical protein